SYAERIRADREAIPSSDPPASPRVLAGLRKRGTLLLSSPFLERRGHIDANALGDSQALSRASSRRNLVRYAAGRRKDAFHDAGGTRTEPGAQSGSRKENRRHHRRPS